MAITAAQVRGARAMLGITQSELAEAADVKRLAVVRFESGETSPYASTLEKIEAALEGRGVVFIETEAGVGLILTSDQ